MFNLRALNSTQQFHPRRSALPSTLSSEKEERQKIIETQKAVKGKYGKKHEEQILKVGKLRHYKCNCLSIKLFKNISS